MHSSVSVCCAPCSGLTHAGAGDKWHCCWAVGWTGVWGAGRGTTWKTVTGPALRTERTRPRLALRRLPVLRLCHHPPSSSRLGFISSYKLVCHGSLILRLPARGSSGECARRVCKGSSWVLRPGRLAPPIRTHDSEPGYGDQNVQMRWGEHVVLKSVPPIYSNQKKRIYTWSHFAPAGSETWHSLFLVVTLPTAASFAPRQSVT